MKKYWHKRNTKCYSEVPNKRPPPLMFFEKKIRPHSFLLGPLRLLIFGFSSLGSKNNLNSVKRTLVFEIQ